jgi:hypothetical protein
MHSYQHTPFIDNQIAVVHAAIRAALKFALLPITRRFVLPLLLALGGGSLHAATKPEELVSELQVALDNHDSAAFEKCFNFDGTSNELRRAFLEIEATIFAWPSHYVFASKRVGSGRMYTVRNDRTYTLNGECSFLINIYAGKTSMSGFNLPAGWVSGRYLVLRTVEK